MRVIGLFRVSTETQASEGTSLDAQQCAFQAMAAKNGWTIVAEFKGHESATQAASDRRVLQQVLSCVRETEPEAIWVIEQSRLSRGDELDVALLMRELKERRVKIVVNGTIRDLNSIDERFMVGIQSLVDRAESERIKERMGRGKRARAAQGQKSSGPAPYGYINPRVGEVGRGTLQIVEAEAMVVRRIFELYAGGKGEKAIAVALNEMGIPASRGGKWAKSSILKVLANPAHIGTAASGVWVDDRKKRSFRYDPTNPKAVLVENAHKPTIDRSLWDAAHNRPKLPRTAVPRMLSKLLYVNGMYYHGDSGQGRTFYRAERGTKGNPWLDCDIVDDTVWSAFASLATSPEFVERLFREGHDPHQHEMVQNEIEWLREQISKQEKRLSRLIEMRADGEIDKATYSAKSDEARQALEKNKKALTEQQAKAVVFDSSHATRVVRVVQTLIGGRTKMTIDQKRRVLSSIVRRVDVTATETGAVFARDAKGHILPGSRPRWGITRVSFVLALPPAGALGNAPRETVPTRAGNATAANVGPTGETSGIGGKNASARCGQKDLASSDWAQEPATEADTRCGQKATTSSCSGRRGRERR